MVLAACTSVRLDQPTPAPSTPRAVDADRYPQPQLRAPPPQPIEATPLPPPARAEAITPPPPAAATPLPTPVPASPESPSPALPSPPAVTTPDPAPAPVPPAPSSVLAPRPASAGAASPSASVPEALAPGRWSVQAGVFMVVQNAQTLRARLDQRLATSGLAPGDRALRIARRDGRLHVVIGDQPDRAGAIRLAAQLREALQQDVTLFAW
jgi:hypothetical protein